VRSPCSSFALASSDSTSQGSIIVLDEYIDWLVSIDPTEPKVQVREDSSLGSKAATRLVIRREVGENEIEEAQKKVKVRILQGAEVNIQGDGSIDVSDKVLKNLANTKDPIERRRDR